MKGRRTYAFQFLYAEIAVDNVSISDDKKKTKKQYIADTTNQKVLHIILLHLIQFLLDLIQHILRLIQYLL